MIPTIAGSMLIFVFILVIVLSPFDGPHTQPASFPYILVIYCFAKFWGLPVFKTALLTYAFSI